MTSTLIAGAEIEVDAEGYLQKPEQWTEAIGLEVARSLGIEMTDRHWMVARFMRQRFLDSGSAPTIRTLGKESGVDVKELYRLFPKGPAKLASKIAGIPKPHGCI